MTSSRCGRPARTANSSRRSRSPTRASAEPRGSAGVTLASAWNRLERTLDASLSGARGISFSEYRLLRTLADAPGSSASRVDLAGAVGLTPSGVTRALRPLEKLRVVKTVPGKRDARLAMATLTRAGVELVSDASGVVDDVMGTVLRRVDKKRPTLSDLLGELTDA